MQKKQSIKNINKTIDGEKVVDLSYDLHWYKDDEYQFYTYTCIELMQEKEAEVEGYDIVFNDKEYKSYNYDHKKLMSLTNQIARRFLNLKNCKEYNLQQEIYDVKVELFNNSTDCEEEYVVKLVLS